MARIVRDSDDDDDFDVTSPTNSPASSSSPGNSRVQKEEPPTSRAKSTSETDILKREIRNAQQQFVDTPSKSMARSDPSPNATEKDLAPLSSKKRRKTTSATDASATMKRIERYKTIKTYGSGKSRRQDIFNSSSSRFDALKADECLDSKSKVVEARPVEQMVWDLPATILDDFVQHDPISMFPDASSTIPDNTMTQKRLIEEALSAKQLALVLTPQAQPPAGSSASSIPWSAYLNTQGGKSQSPAETAEKGIMQPHATESLASGTRSKAVSTKDGLSNTPDGSPTEDRPRMPTPPARMLTKISRTKTSSPATSRRNSVAESVDELALGEQLRRVTRAEQVTVVQISRSKSSRSKAAVNAHQNQPIRDQPLLSELEVHTVAGNDELHIRSKENDEIMVSCTTSKNPAPQHVDKPSKSKKRGSEEILYAEDLIVGLPKEHYKPRPSRSRSTQIVTETPIDFSKRPEATAKGKAKRRKTTNDAANDEVVVSAVATIDAIGSMGFSPSKAEAAVEKIDGNVNQAIDTLIAQRTVEQASLLGKKTKSVAAKAGLVSVEISPPKSRLDSVIAAEDQTVCDNLVAQDQSYVRAIHVEPDREEVPAAPNVQQDTTSELNNNEPITTEGSIEKSRIKQPLSRRKSRQMKILEEDEEDDSSMDEVATKEVRAEKKKRRGRPHRVVVPPADVHPFEDPLDETSKTHPVQDEGKSSTALKEIEPKQATPDIIERREVYTPKTIPLSTPEEKKTASTKCPTNHSPINKSRFPLRVGLSRRARIAPLLRTMKK